MACAGPSLPLCYHLSSAASTQEVCVRDRSAFQCRNALGSAVSASSQQAAVSDVSSTSSSDSDSDSDAEEQRKRRAREKARQLALKAVETAQSDGSPDESQKKRKRKEKKVA